MKSTITYQLKLLPGIIILLALLWLTLGTSFIYLEQQKKISTVISLHNTTNDPDQKPYPFDTEENTETSSNCFVEEYLQTDFDQFVSLDNLLKHNRYYSADAFIIFHAESLSPPPESLS